MGERDDYGNLLSDSLANTNTNTNSLFGDGYTIALPGAGSTALTQSQDNSGNTLALNNNGILGSTALTQSQDNSGNTAALTLADTSGFPTTLDGLKKFVSDNKALFAGAGAGLNMLSNSAGQKTGYQGGIPALTATRNMITAPPTTGYRPGQGGINYGGDVTYTRTPGIDAWSRLNGNSAFDRSGSNNVYNNVDLNAITLASTNSNAASQAAAAAAAKAAADLAAATTAGNAAAIAAAKAAADKAAAAAKAAADKAAADKAAKDAADKAAADKIAADKIAADKAAKIAADKAAADKAAADKAAADKTTAGAKSAGLTYALSHGMTAEQYYKNIFDYYKANSGLSDSMLKSEMLRLGVSAEDLAKATGGDLKAITSRFDAAVAKTPAELAAEQKAEADLATRTAQDTANKTAAEKAAADAAKAKAGSEGYQAAIKAGLTPEQYLGNINQWVTDNSQATAKQIQDAMKEFGVSQTDLQTALGTSNFSDATKTALTTGMGLEGLNKNIQKWIQDNPYATNKQIQDAMKSSGTSNADIANALNSLNASSAKEYSIVNNMGLDKLYQNILDYQAAGHSPEEVAAAMASTGVEQRDIDAAAKFAANTGYTGNATSAAATQNFLNAGATNNAAANNGVVTNAATNSVVDNTAADKAAAEVAAIISGADTGTTKTAEPAGLNTSNSIYQYFADPTTQAALAAGDTRGIAETMQALGWSAQDVAAATGTNAADVQAAYDAALGVDNTDYSYMQAAEGGYLKYAGGGEIAMAKGRYLQGATDGMADELPARIGQNEPAALSHGEFVVPADVVSHLGNGNSDAGAKKLYQMMDKIRMARTGNKKQGKKINPDKFMPGGLASAYAAGGKVKRYAGETTSMVTANNQYNQGIAGTESNLSNWAGPYVTDMLGQGQALANMPYQAYTGQLTAGQSPLQSQAFNAASGLTVPASISAAAQTAGDVASAAKDLPAYSAGTFTNQFTAPTATQATNFTNQYNAPGAYSPTTSSFDASQAQTYMNPYLQASLNPQLDEARRQSQITQQQNAAKMTGAGAFGGSRQAIMDAETQRSLGTNLANITGQGYNTAFNNAQQQFNADQARKMQEAQFGAQQGMTSAQLQAQYGLSAQQANEAARQFGAQQNMTAAQLGAQYGLAGQQAGEQSRQFGANYGLQGLQTRLQAAQAQGALGTQENQAGLNNLNAQLTAGAQQRGIESEGIAADKAQFEEARANPYKMVQFQQSLLQGMPLSAQSYQGIDPSALTKAAQGATTVDALLKNLGLIT